VTNATEVRYENRYLSRIQASEYHGCSTRLIDRLTRDGKLRPIRFSTGRVSFDKVDLDRFMANAKKSS
jgi:hypothetical protein